MNELTMIYDADDGVPFRDGETSAAVERWIQRIRTNQPTMVIFATGNILNAVRVAIKHGSILPSNVLLQYQHPGIPFDEHTWITPPKLMTLKMWDSGGISPWPRGFCDHEERHLMELL